MNQLGKYNGLCPICYKPVKQEDDSREISAGDRTEFYHTSCLHTWVNEDTPEDTNMHSIGMTLLEEYKRIIVGDNRENREMWIASKMDEWQTHGLYLKSLREGFGISVAEVAKKLCVSTPRIKRLERGEPVRDAKLLRRSYYLLMHYIDLDFKFNTYVSATEALNEVNEALIQLQEKGSDAG